MWPLFNKKFLLILISFPWDRHLLGLFLPPALWEITTSIPFSPCLETWSGDLCIPFHSVHRACLTLWSCFRVNLFNRGICTSSYIDKDSKNPHPLLCDGEVSSLKEHFDHTTSILKRIVKMRSSSSAYLQWKGLKTRNSPHETKKRRFLSELQKIKGDLSRYASFWPPCFTVLLFNSSSCCSSAICIIIPSLVRVF